jgi:MoaA/NifB/PqqE/SkfB family radical SAM enzyme
LTFTVPPLYSGGVMLTYKCDNACQHCLYCCSPRSIDEASDEVMSEEMIDCTMSALSKERSLDGIHFGGGESTLFFDRLLYAVHSAVRHRVRLDYLETNAGWCIDDQTATDGFKRLREAGLPGVLISASLFHLEFIPLNVTKTAIRAAHKIFGGAFVWTGEVLRLMEQLPDHDKKYPIQESCRLLGIDPTDGTLWHIHSYLRPSGRASRRLADGLKRYPIEKFNGDACDRTFRATSHFHIDPYGNLFTGHCPGISAAHVDNLHPAIDKQSAPFFTALCEGGPTEAWKRHATEFELDVAGYISKCHFCHELRRYLFKQNRFDEIRPAEMYQS